jgi:outer membrane protein OmpA-like peptidoglycan-associated protein
MRNQVFMALIFSAVLTLTVCAQQTTSNGSAPVATSSSQSVSDREPIPAQTAKDFWDGDDPNLVNLITHPFANKKYVLRHTQPIRDRLNELDQLTSENSSMIKDVDARTQKGLQLASEKTTLADQHATDAASKAQLAQTSATDASTHVSRVEQVVGNLDQYKGTSQTEIRFRSGQTVLSKSAKDALDEMAGALKDQRNYIIEVRGFSTGHGQTAIASSRKMANSVERYLVLNHQIPVYRIYVMSMGNAAVAGEATGAKQVSGGRVEVSIMKNDLSSTQQ